MPDSAGGEGAAAAELRAVPDPGAERVPRCSGGKVPQDDRPRGKVSLS